MFKTNKKVKGIIIIIFGSYLIIGNTLITVIVAYIGPIFNDVQISPTVYLRDWWNEFGFLVIMYATVGSILVFLGILILIENKKGQW